MDNRDQDEEGYDEEDEVEVDVEVRRDAVPAYWRETPIAADRQRRSIVQQPKSAVYGSRGALGSTNGPKPKKVRRTTLWEALTGLVCSLGALATRAAKMATRRSAGEPL